MKSDNKEVTYEVTKVKINMISLSFLKRDSGVGLFMDAEGVKYRVHRNFIPRKLSDMYPGDDMSVNKIFATKCKTRRMIVQNEPKSEHKYKDRAMTCDSKRDIDYYGVPLGTIFYWLGVGEEPNKGDTVLYKKPDNSGMYASPMTSGLVEEVDWGTGMCKVDGNWIDILHVSYVVANPENLIKN